MARFSVPKRYRDGLGLIAKIPEEAICAILAIVEAVRLEDDASHKVLEASLNGTLYTSDDEAREVISSVHSLYRLWGGVDLSLEALIAEISQAVVEDGLVGVADEAHSVFVERLTRLLSVPRLKQDAKVQDLRTEDERVFCRSRVLTDLRPVFGEDLGEGAETFLVLHHLKIVYHAGSESHKEFTVTLDDDDLSELKKVIERAQEKRLVLSKVFGDLQ